MSMYFCTVCLMIGALPKIFWLFESELGEGPDDPKKDPLNPHFDKDEDCYYLGPNPIPIEVQLDDGREFAFKKRGDMPDTFVDYV